MGCRDRKRALLGLTVASITHLLAACGERPRAEAATASRHVDRISIPDSVRLRDDTFPILARPILASRDRRGRLYVTDESDRNIKVYALDGQRLGAVGKAGRGPGEFAQISSAQALGDSLLTYSFHTQTLSIFSESGTLVRETILRRAPYTIRVVDDSLLLFISHPGMSGELLAIARPDGRVLSRFFAPDLFHNQPQLRFLSAVYADAHDGFVFAGIFGSDSLHVFDYTGKEISTRPIPSPAKLDRLEDLLSRNGGRQRRADSAWFHHGMRALMGLVALDHGAVALQIATYDALHGTDLLRSGDEILVVRADTSAQASPVSVITRLRNVGMMLGRDRDGALLIGARSGAGAEDIVVHHESFDPTVERVHGAMNDSTRHLITASRRPRAGPLTIIVLDSAVITTCEDLGRQLRELMHTALAHKQPTMVASRRSDSAFVGEWLVRERIGPVAQVALEGLFSIGSDTVIAPAVLLADSALNIRAGIVHRTRVPNTRPQSFASELGIQPRN